MPAPSGRSYKTTEPLHVRLIARRYFDGHWLAAGADISFDWRALIWD
jgi:hypothetical protein